MSAVATQNLVARHYTPADFATVNAWCVHHLDHAMDERRLPPCGVMVEDEKGPMFVLFAHLSCNIGIAFLEDPIARPGLQVVQARAGFGYALGAMREILRGLNYTLMIAFANKVGAREARRQHGFVSTGTCERMEALV